MVNRSKLVNRSTGQNWSTGPLHHRLRLLINLLFSFIFRTFLILYSDRGLVSIILSYKSAQDAPGASDSPDSQDPQDVHIAPKKCILEPAQVREGRPDLRLFHQLYWIIVCSELLVMYIVFPGAPILQGNFPSETVPGRVCLLLQTASRTSSAFYESESYKLNMFRLFFPSLNIVIIIYLRFRVKRFMSELCPRKQMSCIGVYKRNVIGLQTTINWLISWNILVLLEYGFHTLLAVQGDQLSRETVFWIWNVKSFLFNEGLHFVLPLLLEVPNSSLDRKKIGKDTFYARKTGSLEPRRAEVKTANVKTVKEAPDKTAKDKTVEEATEKPGSLLLSARELLQSKVPASKLIMVEEYRGEDLPNGNINNVSFPNELKDERGELKYDRGELKDERVELKDERDELKDERVELKDERDELKDERDELKDERGESEKLELSIPRSNEGRLRSREPCTVYCRNHNSFARHYY